MIMTSKNTTEQNTNGQLRDPDVPQQESSIVQTSIQQLFFKKNATSFLKSFNQSPAIKIEKHDGLKANNSKEEEGGLDSGEETADSTPKLGKRAKMYDEFENEKLSEISDQFSDIVDFDALEKEMTESVGGLETLGSLKLTRQPKVYIPNKRHCKSKEQTDLEFKMFFMNGSATCTSPMC